MTAFIRVWLLCAIPTAVIAHKKNLDAGTWFMVGAVFGVIGIVIVLCR